MSYSIKVQALVVGHPGDDPGIEQRQVQASFFVPLDGSEVRWSLGGPAAFRIVATDFSFQSPDVEMMLEDARNIARGEILQELARKPLQEIAEMLDVFKEVEW